MNQIFKPEKINLKDHPEISERIIQNKIAEDPSILGLGDLILKDKERMQPRAGRLDLLFQDSETRRFEVEIQLGRSDESHIIRTIEYWDIERRRYPQYDHCAVIIAEDITSRFLNVISLFNGFIPIVAIQMNAFKFGDDIALIFTKILDEMPLGLVDEDEEKDVQQIVTTREYWIKKGFEETLPLADKFLELINEIEGNCQLKYTKINVRFIKEGQIIRYVRLRLRKRDHIVVVLIAQKTEEIDALIENNDFDDMGYTPKGTRYRIRISEEDLATKRESLKELLLAIQKIYNEES
ncbi:hypothetical protein CAP36_14505 [Chitinophagaceae bacterium IBVUCB2]|nr:hypothetical protein CAP36_14505 [Chitinophagaceae bacterium IBVUCB2]